MGSNDNPFDPKYSLGLLSLIGNNTPPKTENALASAPSLSPGISALARAIAGSPEPSPFGAAASDLFGSSNALAGLGAAYDLFGAPTPPTPATGLGSFGALASFLNPKPVGVSDLLNSSPPPPPPANPFGAAASDLFGGGLANALASPPSPLGFGALSGHFPTTNPPPPPALYRPPVQPKPVAPTVKRKAFFSFHFDDIMRVNNVRNGWKITHPDSALNRSFYDSSLWESKKLEGPEAIKRLIREGVCHTSAVCVLAGSETWDRRWVRYEIARTVIDGRGLLTVHLNGINHHVTRTPHAKGYNPLDFMGVAKMQDNALAPVRYVLYEKRRFVGSGRISQWGWFRYDDYTQAVPLPEWLNDPSVNHVMPLSANAAEYDYVADNGSRNIGSWIDQAAKRAGR